VEWLGEIPEHRELRRLKNLCDYTKDEAFFQAFFDTMKRMVEVE